MKILTLKDVEFSGKRVLVRVDFNVPQDKEGKITEDSRIRATLPTLKYIMERGGRLILASHLGRPKGGGFEGKFSLKPVADRLAGILGKPVTLAPDCIGEKVEALVAALKPGEVTLLENLRFHKEEEQNEPGFCQALAKLADIYVNDAFGTAHRAHASTEGITRYVPVKCAGFLLEKEIQYFSQILEHPERPFAAILGGAKVSDKIGVLTNLLSKVDTLLIGGGMAYTFLKAEGLEIGSSLLDGDRIQFAAELLKTARSKGVKVLLPQDHIVTNQLNPPGEVKTIKTASIPSGWIGVDIGPQTIEVFRAGISGAKTIFWNGPVGMFEVNAFSAGTMAMAQIVASSGGISIIGGGDSLAAIKQSGLVEDKISHLSTGGGASLEFLEGKILPGLAALEIKRN